MSGSRFVSWLLVSLWFASGTVPGFAQSAKDHFDPASFGAKVDGTTDDTAAIQKALDAAGKQGGVVKLPTGKYLVAGSLRIPRGVALAGSNKAPLYIEPLLGTVILATGGREKEDGPALFELGDSATVQGLTVYYPEQKTDAIHPYAWTFHLQGGDNTVENVTLINSYNGIRIGPEPNVRHRIRSVSGCVLRRGIWLDNCSDIGRIENVQWHCHWWSSPKVGGDWDKVFKYMWKNCEGFILARTDWEYVTNTFIFPVSIGYHFIATKNGAMNGQLCGIGADAANRCIVVDQIQPMGLLITNGQFVAFEGENPIEIVISRPAKARCDSRTVLSGDHGTECRVARQEFRFPVQLLFQQWAKEPPRQGFDRGRQWQDSSAGVQFCHRRTVDPAWQGIEARNREREQW